MTPTTHTTKNVTIKNMLSRVHNLIVMTVVKKSFLVFLCTASFLVVPLISYAQSVNTTIVVNPEHPRAHEQFSVELTSGSVDLERSTISWYLNDKLGLSGVGKAGFVSTTGPVGTEFRIRAVIEPPSGTTITRTTLVRPQDVDILSRAHAYVPPFYKGKALPPSSGLVVLTAMPHMVNGNGDILDPRNLVYTWSQRGVVLGNASGRGKRTIILENAQIPEYPLVLSLLVTSEDGVASAEKQMQLVPTNPEIIFYERLPLEGVRYSEGFSDFLITKEETVIRAEPYFFSLDDVVNDKISYTWTLNGGAVETPKQKNEIILRKDERTGSALLRLVVENNNLPLRILQEARKDLRLKIE